MGAVATNFRQNAVYRQWPKELFWKNEQTDGESEIIIF